MIKALLCDMDGTLVESNWLHAGAWKDAFAAVDVEVGLEEARRQIGKGGDELIPVFLPWWKREQLEKPLSTYRKFLFEQDYLPRVRAFPQVREFMLRLQQAGIKISLASSADKDQLLVYKRLANVEDLIEEESSASNANRTKPHPDIFQATLKMLGVAASDALALGDTPYDAEAAGKAGVWTIGVTTGGWSEAELLAAGCIEVYHDVADLLEHFDQSALVRS